MTAETFHQAAAEARANARAFEPDCDESDAGTAIFACLEHGHWDVGPHDSTLCPTCRKTMREVIA